MGAHGEVPGFLADDGAVVADDAASSDILHFGDPVAEYRAIRKSVALVHRGGLDWLRLRGADRSRILHALCTQDVEGQKPGRACYALFTDRKGRIRADATFWSAEDETWLELEPSVAASLAQWIDMRVINDDVAIDDLSGVHAMLGVVGPDAGGVLLDVIGEAPPAVGGHGNYSIGGAPVAIRWDDSSGVPGWLIRVGGADLAEVWGTLRQALPDGGCPAGVEAWEAARIEAGHPRSNADFGPEEIPHEAGVVERGVSFSKGCYLGQEVIARVHYRGHVNRELRRIAASRLPESGTEFEVDGKVVGRVTSAVSIPGEGGWVGLAYMRRAYAAPGTRVSLASGDELVVSHLCAEPSA